MNGTIAKSKFSKNQQQNNKINKIIILITYNIISYKYNYLIHFIKKESKGIKCLDIGAQYITYFIYSYLSLTISFANNLTYRTYLKN